MSTTDQELCTNSGDVSVTDFDFPDSTDFACPDSSEGGEGRDCVAVTSASNDGLDSVRENLTTPEPHDHGGDFSDDPLNKSLDEGVTSAFSVGESFSINIVGDQNLIGQISTDDSGFCLSTHDHEERGREECVEKNSDIAERDGIKGANDETDEMTESRTDSNALVPRSVGTIDGALSLKDREPSVSSMISATDAEVVTVSGLIGNTIDAAANDNHRSPGDHFQNSDETTKADSDKTINADSDETAKRELSEDSEKDKMIDAEPSDSHCGSKDGNIDANFGILNDNNGQTNSNIAENSESAAVTDAVAEDENILEMDYVDSDMITDVDDGESAAPGENLIDGQNPNNWRQFPLVFYDENAEVNLLADQSHRQELPDVEDTASRSRRNSSAVTTPDIPDSEGEERPLTPNWAADSSNVLDSFDNLIHLMPCDLRGWSMQKSECGGCLVFVHNVVEFKTLDTRSDVMVVFERERQKMKK